jgi:hypothetical protein
MAQEQQQRAGAEYDGEGDCDYAVPHPVSVLADEPEEEYVNGSTHRGHADN